MAGMPESAKGIINWVLVVGIVAFVLLIFGIIFGNLSGNLGWEQESTKYYNETILLTDAPTGTIPAGAQNRIDGLISSVVITNITNDTQVIIDVGNYTYSGVIIIGTGSTQINNTNVNVTYTVTYDSQGDINTNDIIQNYTQSGVNTATQLPAVGTIVGIVLLIIILLSALIFVIVKLMGIADGTGTSSNAKIKTDFGSSNGKF